MSVVAGVDGRRGGWAVALAEAPDTPPATGRGRGLRPRVTWRTVPGQDAAGFAAVLALCRDAGAVAVGLDCPTGLPENDWRACDLLAKRRLGRASARVFLAPPRAVLEAPTYAQARLVARDTLGGRGISAQTYGLRRVVLAVDEALRARVPGADLVVEVHPELSFMALAGRAPGDPLPSKKTSQGRAARLAALAGWLGAAALDGAPDGDDHLDALATAWTAARWARGEAEVLGGDADAAGLPVRIVV